MAPDYSLLVEGLEEAADASAAAEAALSALSSALVAVEAEADPARAMGVPFKAATAAAEAARRACREFELEMGGVASSSAAAQRLVDQQQTAARRLTQLLGTLDFLRATRQREVLLDSSSSGGAGGGGSGAPGGDAEVTPKALLALGAKVQIESQQAIMRMTRMVDASREIGAQTLGNMEQQHRKLKRMRDTAAAQAAQFEMAESELREFAQSALGDGITQALLMVIGLAFAFIVTWRLSGGESPAAAAQRVHAPDGWPSTVWSPLDLRAG
jgi:hypothetical protein